MHIRCPWCGPRELEEFRFRSVVTDGRIVAEFGIATQQAAVASDEVVRPYTRVYERANTPQSSVEYWQHERGCRAWLVVRRNPSTAEVLEVRLLGAGSP